MLALLSRMSDVLASITNGTHTGKIVRRESTVCVPQSIISCFYTKFMRVNSIVKVKSKNRTTCMILVFPWIHQFRNQRQVLWTWKSVHVSFCFVILVRETAVKKGVLGRLSIVLKRHNDQATLIREHVIGADLQV